MSWEISWTSSTTCSPSRNAAARATRKRLTNWRALTDESNPEQRKYLRLAALLREEITGGLRAPGSSLPSIGDLCRAHDVSRQTAGQALRNLRVDELIYRMPGLGYFVAAVAVNDK